MGPSARYSAFALALLIGTAVAPAPAAQAASDPSQGTLTTVLIGPEPVRAFPRYDSSVATTINDLNQVVGTMSFDGQQRGFLWQSSHLTDLGAGMIPVDINNKGEVAGTRASAEGRTTGFVWKDGASVSLVVPNRDVAITDLNDRGDVVGYSYVDDPQYGLRGFRWRRGSFIDLGDSMKPLFVNRSGQVAGENFRGPFIWTAGTMRRLTVPAVPGELVLTDFNDRGDLVGNLADGNLPTPSGMNASTALLWRHDQDTAAVLGSNESYAEGLNNKGQVALFDNQGESGTWTDGTVAPVLLDNGEHARIFDIMDVTDRGDVLAGSALVHKGGIALLPSSGQAKDVNKRGMVVGSVDNRAAMFFWTQKKY